MDRDLLLVAVIMAFVLAMGGVLLRRMLRLRKNFARLAAGLGGTHRYPRGASRLADTEFTYELVLGGKHTPNGVCVSVAVHSAARFYLHAKPFQSGIFPAIGITAIGLTLIRGAHTTVQTGDGEFDGRFLLVCDSTDTGRLLSSPRNRVLVRQLLKGPHDLLTHDGRTVEMTDFSSPDRFTPQGVRRLVPPLAMLAAEIRQHARP